MGEAAFCIQITKRLCLKQAQGGNMPNAKTTAKSSLIQQGAKFGVVGISNTIIDYTLYLAVTKLP
jgi:hypothetical protein